MDRSIEDPSFLPWVCLVTTSIRVLEFLFSCSERDRNSDKGGGPVQRANGMQREREATGRDGGDGAVPARVAPSAAVVDRHARD